MFLKREKLKDQVKTYPISHSVKAMLFWSYVRKLVRQYFKTKHCLVKKVLIKSRCLVYLFLYSFAFLKVKLKKLHI